MKKLIVRVIFKLFNKLQHRQIHSNGKCLGEVLQETYGYRDYFRVSQINLSWYIILGKVIFIETITKYNTIQYDICLFKNSIFTNAIYLKEEIYE